MFGLPHRRAFWFVAAAIGGAAVMWMLGNRAPMSVESPVAGIAGWEALSEGDRRRARTPLSADARRWLDRYASDVREVAALFDVSPVALGGIVAAEKTLLVGRVDVIGEDLFEAIFGSMREADLERWVADQELAFQRVPRGRSISVVRNPYLWTLGPAQVSFRLAVQNEPAIAERLGRPPRSAKQVLAALMSMPGNLEYAAALLAEAQRAYGEVAGFDISSDPGILATLYHVGAPTVRARRLRSEIAEREPAAPPLEPQVNFYGAFVGYHAIQIAALLGVGD